MNSAEELRVLTRRTKVSELVCRGIRNQFDICARLGMDESQQSVISKDIKWIRKEWREARLENVTEFTNRELAKIDLMEREAWEAWERSKLPAKRNVTRLSRKGEADSDRSAEEETKGRDGDPRYLEVIMKCITQRCTILGITGGESKSPSGDTNIVINIVEKDKPPVIQAVEVNRDAGSTPTGNAGNFGLLDSKTIPPQ